MDVSRKDMSEPGSSVKENKRCFWRPEAYRQGKSKKFPQARIIHSQGKSKMFRQATRIIQSRKIYQFKLTENLIFRVTCKKSAKITQEFDLSESEAGRSTKCF
jgi:hypothetical protein